MSRASTALPAFALTEANALSVARICQQLDGIPLAIELAAARVRVLAVEQIAARLDTCLGLLTAGGRTALPRHQTMRAAIDWSYALLTEQERRLFRRLSVFAGTFGLEAAEAVAAGGRSDERTLPQELLDLLSRLIDKSLVVSLEREGEVRYRLLEPIRQYGWEQLAAADEAEEVYTRHRDWYLTLARRTEPLLRGREQLAWLRRLETEHDNLRAALKWCLSRQESAAVGLELAQALWWFWILRSYFSEGRRWLDDLRSSLADSASLSPGGKKAARLLHATTLYQSGALAWVQGDLSAARTLTASSVTESRALGDKRTLAYALMFQGLATDAAGDHQSACALE
ncbi:MAG: ATP-binding protein, partial [Candidatus Acidiferrales bacterium]